MIEKQARIKQAGAGLGQAIQAVAAENAHNIKVAQYNWQTRFVGTGELEPYRNDAFLRMIKQARELVTTASED